MGHLIKLTEEFVLSCDNDTRKNDIELPIIHMTRQCNDVTTHSASSPSTDSRHSTICSCTRNRWLLLRARHEIVCLLRREPGVDQQTSTCWWFMDLMMVLNDIIHTWLNLISVSLSVGVSIYFDAHGIIGVAIVRRPSFVRQRLANRTPHRRAHAALASRRGIKMYVTFGTSCRSRMI